MRSGIKIKFPITWCVECSSRGLLQSPDAQNALQEACSSPRTQPREKEGSQKVTGKRFTTTSGHTCIATWGNRSNQRVAREARSCQQRRLATSSVRRSRRNYVSFAASFSKRPFALRTAAAMQYKRDGFGMVLGSFGTISGWFWDGFGMMSLCAIPKPTNQQTNQPAQPTNQPTSQPTNQPTPDKKTKKNYRKRLRNGIKNDLPKRGSSSGVAWGWGGVLVVCWSFVVLWMLVIGTPAVPRCQQN